MFVSKHTFNMYDPKHVFGIFGNFSCVALLQLEKNFRPFHFIHLQNNRETSTDLSPIPLFVYRLYSCLFIAYIAYTVVCLSPILLFVYRLYRCFVFCCIMFFSCRNIRITEELISLLLKEHLEYVLRSNRGKNIYFFSHI